ncbi:MAG: gluconate 2-dehydrogenase gamma chain, partial [Neolewinella sp.]
MDRRTTIKNLLAGAAGAALLSQATACEAPADLAKVTEAKAAGYGLRLPHELKHDARIANDSFFNEPEKIDLGILADIITPGTDTEPKATDTGVVDFFEFISLDLPDYHQNILRGGLGWLNIEAGQRFGRYFSELTEAERIQIVDD